MKALYGAAFFFLLAGIAQAQVQPVIVGPKTAELGDLVILDASQTSGATAFRWILVNSKKTYLPIEGGTKVVFASGSPGEYIFVLVAAGAGNNGQLIVEMVEHRIILGDGPPGPGPGPGPGPTPPPTPPDVPDGELGLTKFSFLAADKLTEHRDLAAKFADNYESVASKMAAGGYLSLGQANEDLTARNRDTHGSVPGARDAWLNAFFLPHAEEMARLAREDKLKTDQQSVSRAYKATSDGLKLVK